MSKVEVTQDGNGQDVFKITDDNGGRVMISTEGIAREYCAAHDIDWDEASGQEPSEPSVSEPEPEPEPEEAQPEPTSVEEKTL